MKLIYGIILGMIIMYIITNNNKKKNNTEKQIEFAAQKLVRQAARWSTAAKQDKNSMIAVLHLKLWSWLFMGFKRNNKSGYNRKKNRYRYDEI